MWGGGSLNVGSLCPMKANNSRVEIEMPNGHQIDDADGDPFLKERRTLGDEGIAMLGTILVRRADDLDGCDQLPTPFGVVDSDLVFVVIRQRRFHGYAGMCRRPYSGSHTAVSFARHG